MELKHLLFFGVCLGIVAYTQAIEGSGDVVQADTVTQLVNTVISDTDSDNDQDISGDDPTPVIITTDDEGSGADVDEETQTNKKCEMNYCWCTYTDGSEIPNTRVYVRQLDCSPYKNTVAPVTTMRPSVPTRPAPVTKGHAVNTVTQEVTDDDIIFVEESTTSVAPPKTGNNLPGLGPDSDIDIETKTDDKPGGGDFDNNVPTSVDIIKSEDIDKDIEQKEEETNSIFGAGLLKGEGDTVQKQLVRHPGIMAALIGGGVVGLLCFVLIILFIVYRVRKKDEGSYPLGDEKPLKNYAYSKAPSQEFYA